MKNSLCGLFKFISQHQALVLLVSVGVVIAIIAPFTHDYKSYVVQWDIINLGKNPWIDINGTFTGNAYGPLHNLLAIPYSVFPSFPRVIFVAAFLFSAIWLLRYSQACKANTYALLPLIILNPFFWVSCVLYGQNDILPASLSLFALYLFTIKHERTSALLLGFAVLFKIYPVVIVPFLMLSRKRLNFQFSTVFLGTVVVGYLGSFLLWGKEFIYVFQFSADRTSKLSSIFRFLRSRFSPLEVFVDQPNLDWLSVYLLIASLGLLLILYIRYQFSYVCGATLAILITFTLYKVGHFQFYSMPFFLLTFLYISYQKELGDIDNKPIVLYFLWFSLIPPMYVALEGFTGEYYIIRNFLGVPSLIVQCYLIWNLGKFSLVSANKEFDGIEETTSDLVAAWSKPPDARFEHSSQLGGSR